MNELRTARWWRKVGTGLLSIALAAGMAACDRSDAAESEYSSQSTVKPIPGVPGHHTVTFTPLGAERVGIATGAVEGTEELKELPYASLLYNADGSTFVYTSPKALTYRYEEISLEKIVGERIYFTKGPKVGTQVVTDGVPQVHGADIELEFGEIA